MTAPVLRPFAKFVADAQQTTFDENVLHAAKRCLLDYMGATIPGGVVAPATLLKDAFADILGRGGAFLYPGSETTDAKTAALINGAASHTIEFDDIFRDGIYHPGVPVISAALAVAESKNVSGDMLLRGIIAGYEVSNRIARTVNPAHYAYWHTTGTVGTFGAAAAAATILELSEEQALNALANAGTLAAGLQQAFRGDAMSKPMHGGHAAETGITCALSAKAGVTGVQDMLEGERGFGKAMCDNPDWTNVASGLGTEFTIIKTTTKNHAACGHAHAAIDAASHIQASHNFKPDDIDRIDAGTYGPAVEIVGGQEITTAFEAKFSLPYCVAVTLTTGSCRTAAFEPALLANEDILALAKRIFVTKDPACDDAFPKQRSATVTIRLKNGDTFSHHAPTRKGDPDAPLSDDELSKKYRELSVPVIGESHARELEDRVWKLESLSNVAALYPSLSAAAE